MNHTENYKKYAYRSILIMMLGVVFFILFGSRLISQNVYASYDSKKIYAGGDILLFEKVWEDDQEKDRPNSISFKATLVKTIGQDEEIEIELTKDNNWQYKIESNNENNYKGYKLNTIKELKVDGYEYIGEDISFYVDKTDPDKEKEVAYIKLRNKKIQTFGNLTVSKDVNGNKGDINKDFHFTVKLSDSSINGIYGDMTFKDGIATFTLKDNESITATSLPTGISYKVIEQEANQDGYITTSTGTTGEIQKNAISKAEFINTKNEYGSLTVLKDVNGNKGDTNKDFHFTVTLSDTSINGTYGDMTFKDGVATFTLKDNESLTATSLPTGITYKVIEQEANQDGYVTTSTNDKGYILNNQNIKVYFINTKEVKPQSSNQTPPENDHQSQPQTGDDSALMVYMSLGIMSGLSALGLILLKKKA